MRVAMFTYQEAPLEYNSRRTSSYLSVGSGTFRQPVQQNDTQRDIQVYLVLANFNAKSQNVGCSTHVLDAAITASDKLATVSKVKYCPLPRMVANEDDLCSRIACQ